MDWYFFAPILVLSAAILALSAAYLRPPRGSIVALRRRLADLEATVETDGALLQRLKKRHYSLEGHVYGSDDDEPEVAAPGDLNPSSQPGPGTLALIPDSDFPEDEFQAALARRKGTHA